MYGLILGGDLAGTGAGFLVAGSMSSVLSWRFAFWWPVLPSLALAWLVWRLPEPDAEAVRSLLRALGEAAAPPLFGYVSQSLSGANAAGLEYTFLLFLIPLMCAGFLALTGLRTYPRDVATARASIRALRESPG